MNKLEEQLTQIADQHGEMVIYEGNKYKMERAKKRYELLKDFVGIISDGVMNAELVWVLMELDMGRIKNRNYFDDLMEQYKTEIQACKKRTVNSNFDFIHELLSNVLCFVCRICSSDWNSLHKMSKRPSYSWSRFNKSF